MNDTDKWVPTAKRGGVRRQRGVAQLAERHSDEVEADSAQGSGFIARRTQETEEAPRGLQSPKQGRRGWPRVGFKSLPRDKFKWTGRTELGIPSCPYVIRWMLETPFGSIRLHHWLAPDDDRAKHDHPWWFATFVIKGGYTDSGADGDDHLRAPTIRFRRAEHQHTVFPDPGGAWTIMVTGPKSRQWGFWVKGKFVKSYRYFYKFGHHPCD